MNQSLFFAFFSDDICLRRRLIHLLRVLVLFTTMLISFIVPGFEPVSGQDCTPASGSMIRIGAVFPRFTLFTGAINESYAGAEAMRQAVNACGGVAGHPVEWDFVPAEDRSSGDAAVRKLAAQGIPLIIGSGSEAVSQGAASATEALGIVYWEVSDSLEQPGTWVFSPRPTHYQVGQQAARLLDTQFPDARLALIYEKRDVAEQVVTGIRDTLARPPALIYGYSNPDDQRNSYAVASQMRDEGINALIMVAFENDGFWLWYMAREADANVNIWLHIGSEGYCRRCSQESINTDYFASIGPLGDSNRAYRVQAVGEMDQRYRAYYEASTGQTPSIQADLSASGVYLLLNHILPTLVGEYTAENIQALLQTVVIPDSTGLLGEGVRFEGGLNTAAVAPVRQKQNGILCTVLPATIATCEYSLQPFPTWRQRAMTFGS